MFFRVEGNYLRKVLYKLAKTTSQALIRQMLVFRSKPSMDKIFYPSGYNFSAGTDLLNTWADTDADYSMLIGYSAF